MRIPWLIAGSASLAAILIGRSARAQTGGWVAPYSPPQQATATSATYGYPPQRPGAARLRYEPGVLPPAGYHLEENPRKGLLVAGAITFGVPYLISVMIGGASRNEADRWLLVPVGGPAGALAYGRRDCDDDNGLECAANVLAIVGLAFDLAAQTAGAMMFTMGYIFPKKEWVSDMEARGKSAPVVAWSIAPRFDPKGGVGLSVAGTLF